jgi:uncharacterized repeat protein (TIGR01451 family)
MQISNGFRIIGLTAALAACALALPAAGLARNAGTCTQTTGSASGITSTSATLNGTHNGGGYSRKFSWGLTTGYGNDTAAASPGAPGALSAAITGLAPGTTYHFAMWCSSIAYGFDASFTTLAGGPPAGSESADVGVVKTVTPATVAVGSTATFKIVATNVVGATALNVFVTDQLPAALSLVTATATQGSCSGTTLVTCTIGTLTSGQSETITIVVSAATAGSVTNTANIGASNPDPNLATNNHSSATLVVTGGAATTTTPPPPTTTAPTLPPPARRVVRDVSARVGASTIKGTVGTRPSAPACAANVPVRLERTGSPGTVVASKRTGSGGAFSFPRPKKAGTYRVVVPSVVVGGRTCLFAVSAGLPLKAS